MAKCQYPLFSGGICFLGLYIYSLVDVGNPWFSCKQPGVAMIVKAGVSGNMCKKEVQR
jgi:hypothetical protein